LAASDVDPRQVGEQPAQVRVSLGSHCLVEPLVELGLVEPPVPEVLGQQVSDLGALGVGEPQIGVPDAASGCGQNPGLAARR
jgi:hypothetical protein